MHTRLMQDGINIQNGDNTFIFNAKIDNGVLLAEENSEASELIKVSAIDPSPACRCCLFAQHNE